MVERLQLLAFTIACGKGICFGSGAAGVSAMAAPVPLVGWLIAGIGMTISVILTGIIIYKAYHTVLQEIAVKNINQHLLINKLSDKKQACETIKDEHEELHNKLSNQIQTLADQLTQSEAQLANISGNKLSWWQNAKLKSQQGYFNKGTEWKSSSAVSQFRPAAVKYSL